MALSGLSQQQLTELASHGSTMVPGAEAGTAIRIRVESCPKGGCLHLEQMAYSHTLGWYRQKSFQVPRELVGSLAQVLRMGQCLLSQPSDSTHQGGEAAPLPFSTPSPHRTTGENPRQRSG